AEWGEQNGFLLDTCLAAQDRFKQYLEYFRIE
ncbi:cell filamentation protein Fic, partial [Streptococcus suis]|nr:cell filamentation protein Fic [Streptococcus suis]